MDNEKMNGAENLPGKDNGEITAEDLIKRLRSNIKKDPNYTEGDLLPDGSHVILCHSL